MSGGRAVGRALLFGAGLVGAVMVLWLLVSGASSGGIVLGLLLVLVIAGPLAGAGWWVLARQPAEERAAAQFDTSRQVLDADRVFRKDIVATLRTLGERNGAPRERLLAVAQSVEAGGQREQTIQLDDAAIDTLRRYDDLVWQRVRRMRDLSDARQIEPALGDLQRSLDQRQDLLTRGRLAPGIDPADLLRAAAPRTDLAEIAVGDAVSRDTNDYVIESMASYFADGARWKLARLVSTSDAKDTRWLYVAPGGAEAAVLDERSDVQATAESVQLSGKTLPLVSSGSAVADVVGSSGSAQGVLVAYRRYQSGPDLALVEEWPDGTRHSYVGETIGPIDLEVWPTARSTN